MESAEKMMPRSGNVPGEEVEAGPGPGVTA